MTLDAPFLLKILRTVLCALAVAAATTPLAKWLAKKLGAVDVPRDGRRMHDHPIPRMGGLAIILGFLTAVLLFLDIDREVRGILIGAGIIAILGMFDDIYDLHAGLKFLVQIVIINRFLLMITCLPVHIEGMPMAIIIANEKR